MALTCPLLRQGKRINSEISGSHWSNWRLWSSYARNLLNCELHFNVTQCQLGIIARSWRHVMLRVSECHKNFRSKIVRTVMWSKYNGVLWGRVHIEWTLDERARFFLNKRLKCLCFLSSELLWKSYQLRNDLKRMVVRVVFFDVIQRKRSMPKTTLM